MRPPIDKKLIAEHEARVKEFDSREEDPAAYICFVWPEFSRWQAIVAYEAHKTGLQRVQDLAIRGRRAHDPDAPDPDLQTQSGDILNALAELVLRGVDNGDTMGPMALFVSIVQTTKYMVAVAKRSDRRDGGDGSSVQIERMEGVSNVAEARVYMDNHPLVIAAKTKLLEDLAKGPQH